MTPSNEFANETERLAITAILIGVVIVALAMLI